MVSDPNGTSVSLARALVLGIVQGLTEFFPISSSGHLLVVRWLLGWELGSAAVEKSFDAAVHLGTAAAAVVFLRRELFAMMRSTLSRHSDRQTRLYRRLGILVVVASIPAALAGVAGERFVEERLGSPLLVAVQLAIFGVLLLIVERISTKTRNLDKIGTADALTIGTAQVLALSPGVSRSGITITAGLARGFDSSNATKFSFLLLVPVTTGAGAFKVISMIQGGWESQLLLPFAVGIGASAIAGFAAAWFLSTLVKTRSFLPFVIYRVIAAGFIVSVWLLRR
ncbi:MAG: undecaprenyl-diphosphatase [Acidimicrobiia bacterium]